MRAIFAKLTRSQPLTDDEYARLIEYAGTLRTESPESYTLFYERYAALLKSHYATYLPRFACGIDDLVNFLLSRPDLLSCLQQGQVPFNLFPPSLQPYLQYLLGSDSGYHELQPLLQWFKQNPATIVQLPAPRENEIVYKYEDSNPYKEQGLKAHFDRLGRYSFITRLQTYRYLTRNRVGRDRIEYRNADQLGGIFSNKTKSIYYLIFLSEADNIKTKAAGKLLNSIFYGE